MFNKTYPPRQTMKEEMDNFFTPEYDSNNSFCNSLKNCANCTFLSPCRYPEKDCVLYVSLLCCSPFSIIGICVTFPLYMMRAGFRKIKKKLRRRKEENYVDEIVNLINNRVIEKHITTIIIDYVE